MAVVLATLAPPAASQPQFAELRGPRMPADNQSTQAIALGDVDGDGDLDMVLANNGRNRLYLNSGLHSGAFIDATAQRMPAVNDSTTDVVLGDVDGDGDPDLVFGNSGQNRLYLNDGTGAFTDVTAQRLPAASYDTFALALGDVDGDGDLDLVVGNSVYSYTAPQNQLYLNDGTGTFVDVTALRMPAEPEGTSALALGDVDGDGDLDLIIGRVSTPGRIYLNDGTGTFSNNVGSRLPQYPDNTLDLAFGDVDGDGDGDIVVGNGVFGMFWPAQSRLYLNDGAGFFRDGVLPPTANLFTDEVALGDVDGDGDLDIVFANYGSSPYSTPVNRLLVNSGNGTFTDDTAQRMPAVPDESHAVALGDVDGDGDLDLAVGNYGQDRLYLDLLRQLDAAPTVGLGRAYRLDAYARYGPQGVQTLAGVFLSTGTGNLPLPPWGTFRLDPARLAAVPPFVIPPDPGLGSVSFVVPNVPGLVGTALFAQALLVQSPVAYLTDLTASEIVP